MEGSRVKAIVMITVAIAWLAYVGTELARGRQPDVWTWGILTGVYAALYQPWTGKGPGRGQNDQRGLPGPGPGVRGQTSEDEA